jgi:hypothetical protein
LECWKTIAVDEGIFGILGKLAVTTYECEWSNAHVAQEIRVQDSDEAGGSFGSASVFISDSEAYIGVVGCLDWKWLSNLARSSSLFISDSWLEVAWIGNGF